MAHTLILDRMVAESLDDGREPGSDALLPEPREAGLDPPSRVLGLEAGGGLLLAYSCIRDYP